MTSINVLAAKRRRARHFCIQALYQWSMTGATASSIETEFRTDNDFTNVDTEYFNEMLVGIIRRSDELDGIFLPFWTVSLMCSIASTQFTPTRRLSC